MSTFRDNIDAMSGYIPGEQPGPGEKVIKLNTNENPYPPSPAALEALCALDADLLRRYPHPMAERFRRTAAGVLGVDREWVLAGNGSDDLLTMICRACLEPGRNAACPVPTYVLYETLTAIQNAEAVEVPSNEDYDLPVDGLLAAAAAVTFIASPNSPSGTVAARGDLERLADGLDGVLVIDEAYVDFADANALDMVRTFDNVIVLRTLSKSYSLAGLRLGFGVAQPPLLDGLIKVKDSYNVDAVACTVGAAAMNDQAHMLANAARICASRAAATTGLEAMGFRVWPSQANFLLTRPPAGDAERIYEALKAAGILVRYFKQPRLDDKLRITVGTDEQNAALLGALKEIL